MRRGGNDKDIRCKIGTGGAQWWEQWPGGDGSWEEVAGRHPRQAGPRPPRIPHPFYIFFCILHFCISKLKSGRKTSTGGWTLSSSNSTPFLYFFCKKLQEDTYSCLLDLVPLEFHVLFHTFPSVSTFYVFFLYIFVFQNLNSVRKTPKACWTSIDLLDSMPFHLLGHICLFGKA